MVRMGTAPIDMGKPDFVDKVCQAYSNVWLFFRLLIILNGRLIYLTYFSVHTSVLAHLVF